MQIRLDKVSFTYQTGTPFARQALREVSLQVAAGECLGLGGPSGSGKTTLLQLVNGLLKPSSGQVRVGELDSATLGPRQLALLRRKLGLVFQHPERQFVERLVFDEIAFGLRYTTNVPDQEYASRVGEALQAVGLEASDAHREISRLSGGEKRRVALAGILVMRPQALLLDEPTAGLDYPATRSVITTLQALKREGTTLLLVSHDFPLLFELCDRLAILQEGRLVYHTPLAELGQHIPFLQEMGIQLPVPTRLAASLAQRGFTPGAHVFTDPQALVAAILDQLIT